VIAATMYEIVTAGPASCAPCPVATNIPVPTTEPITRAAISKALTFFLSPLYLAASLKSSTDFFLNKSIFYLLITLHLLSYYQAKTTLYAIIKPLIYF
jgi:hypothetical protein